MATQTRPFLKTGVALAGAAAIVAATPQIMPSLTAPTPLKLAEAQVELADFASFLYLLNPQDIAASYFAGWGNSLEPDVPCCAVFGLPGIAYMLGDALINGVFVDGEVTFPNDPTAINYFYELGPSYGVQYLLQQATTGVPGADVLLTLLFAGPQIVALGFQTILETAAALVSVIPVVGPLIAGGIDAYLNGYEYSDGSVSNPLLPGVLAYAIAEITALFDGLLPGAGAATASAAARSALVTLDVPAAAVATPAESAPKAEATVEATPAASAPQADAATADPAGGADTAPAVTPAVEVDATPAVGADKTPAAEVDTTPAVEVDTTPELSIADIKDEVATAPSTGGSTGSESSATGDNDDAPAAEPATETAPSAGTDTTPDAGPAAGTDTGAGDAGDAGSSNEGGDAS